MEPFLITIDDRCINPHQIVTAVIDDDGPTVRLWMVGDPQDDPIVIKGDRAKELWNEFGRISTFVANAKGMIQR
jgi:hypothetical protein